MMRCDSGETTLRLPFPDQARLADVAHEIINIVTAREGYPLMLHGLDAVGMTNSLLDLEVDRRVAAVGDQ